MPMPGQEFITHYAHIEIAQNTQHQPCALENLGFLLKNHIAER